MATASQIHFARECLSSSGAIGVDRFVDMLERATHSNVTSISKGANLIFERIEEKRFGKIKDDHEGGRGGGRYGIDSRMHLTLLSGGGFHIYVGANGHISGITGEESIDANPGFMAPGSAPPF